MFTAKQATELTPEDKERFDLLCSHIDKLLSDSPFGQLKIMLATTINGDNRAFPWRFWAEALRLYKEAGWHAYIIGVGADADDMLPKTKYLVIKVKD